MLLHVDVMCSKFLHPYAAPAAAWEASVSYVHVCCKQDITSLMTSFRTSCTQN